ncbi:MAG: hypothetical protein QOG54_1658 [Actinomycetota bacterium]|jgi:predicted transcriptional regulator|nr:hypothetical protein [Actinomycetota bacterium]
MEAPSFWLPASDEWLDETDAGELVVALRELITELVGWGVDA